MFCFLLPNSQNHCHQGGGPQMREGLNYKWGWNNKLQNYLWLLFFFEQKIITKGSQSNLEVSIKKEESEKFQGKIIVIGFC